MLAELQAAKPDLNVELIGINAYYAASGIPGMVALCNFPWVQDSTTNSVWTAWNAIKDDLFIVDSLGRKVVYFPISSYDLTYPTNREALKQKFLAAAAIRDTDADGVPDDWAQLYLNSATASPNGDPDGDGRNNFTEYAFGTDPRDGNSSLPVRASIESAGGESRLLVVFHRRAGSVLDYYLEASSDLVHWVPISQTAFIIAAPRNLYDGTGTAEVRMALKLAPGDPVQWVRVRAVPPPKPIGGGTKP